jgi:hypothetical protein
MICSEYLYIIIKGLSGLIGIICLFLAFFPFKSEESKIQSILEALWIRLDDKNEKFVLRSSKYFNSVSQIATLILDKYFGKRLLSFQSLWVSAFYTVGFYLLAITFLVPEESTILSTLTINVIIGFSLFSFSFIPALINTKIWIKWGCLSVLTIYALYAIKALFFTQHFLVFLANQSYSNKFMFGLSALGSIGSIITCFLLIALFRKILLKFSSTLPLKKFFITLGLMVFLPIITLGLPYLLSRISFELYPPSSISVGWENFYMIPLAVSLINTTSIFPIILYLILISIFPLYRMIWTLLHRIIYSIAEYKMIANRSFMFSLSVFFIGFALNYLPQSEMSRDNRNDIANEQNDSTLESFYAIEVPDDFIIKHNEKFKPTCNSSTIYGGVIPQKQSVYVWFEWGESKDKLTHQTPKWAIIDKDSIRIKYPLTNLKQNTTYYYTLFLQELDGAKFHATIEKFTTLKCE